eukprot:1599243-Prymnesium_polylepis.1
MKQSRGFDRMASRMWRVGEPDLGGLAGACGGSHVCAVQRTGERRVAGRPRPSTRKRPRVRRREPLWG